MEKQFTLSGHNIYITELLISSNNQIFISASQDTTIRVWDLKAKKLVKILNGHKGKVYCMSLSFNGKYLISGSCDKTIRV
jgi:FOG: WD40 repeat